VIQKKLLLAKVLILSLTTISTGLLGVSAWRTQADLPPSDAPPSIPTDTLREACGQYDLSILSTTVDGSGNTWVHPKWSENLKSEYIPEYGTRIYWSCGGSDDHSDCGIGTNAVQVEREALPPDSNRRFYIYCLTLPVQPAYWCGQNSGDCTISVAHRDPNNPKRTWYTILKPVVNRPDPYTYDQGAGAILFHAGDNIYISASGCVNIDTGASFYGDTWKRYVNPSGADADPPSNNVQGTIHIDGLGMNGLELIRNWIDKPLTITQDSVLQLGYRDDNYADNSYRNRGTDSGPNGQCGGINYPDYGGPAFVEIIVTPLPEPPTPVPTPTPSTFDLVPGAYDSNRLPLNPKWGWQVLGQGTTNPLDSCAGLHYETPDGDNVKLGAPPCSTQTVTTDRSHEGFWGSIPFIGKLCVPDDPKDTSRVYGHVNWRTATYTGTVEWSGLSGDSGGFEAFYNDGDYNFEFTPSNGGGVTSFNPNTIELEFDSGETVNSFDSLWWRKFHDAVIADSQEAVDRRIPNTHTHAKQLVDSHEAIVVGLVGLDAVHGAKSEIHPIFAIAIRMNAPKEVKSDNDGWAIFVRNWGNEGMCSHEQHYLDIATLTLALPPPGSAQHADIIHETTSFFTNNNGVSLNLDTDIKPDGIHASFSLPQSEARPITYGELHIKWMPALAQRGASSSQPTSVVSRGRAEKLGGKEDGGDPEDRLDHIYSQLSPSQRDVFTSTIPVASLAQSVTLTVPVHLGPAPSQPDTSPQERAVPDPNNTETTRVNNITRGLCFAFNGKIPFSNTICNGFSVANLPMMYDRFKPMPNLVVQIASIEPAKSSYQAGEPVTVTLVITNTGTNVTTPFWTDLIINPASVPSTPQIWNDNCSFPREYCFGVAWHITQTLRVGESITVTTAADGFAKAYSNWPGWFANGTSKLYAFVDSWSPGSTNGEVIESNEGDNMAERDISVVGTNPPAPTPSSETALKHPQRNQVSNR